MTAALSGPKYADGMDLQAMLDQAATGDVHVEAGWGQGRATFGGLVGGLLVSAMLPHVPEAASLRSLTVNFVAPVVPGAAQAEVEVLRSGKSATQVLGTLRQEGAPVAVALGAFGAPRESAISVAATAEAPQMAAPETIEPFPYIAGMTPDFFQHLEMRLADGGFPYSGASTSHMDGWMRFRQAPPTFDIRHFVTLVDCWPPAVVQMLSELKPGSSMTWTLEIVDDVTAEPDTHWAYSVRTDVAGGGYGHTDARVWHPDGRLVAISRQTVAVFG